MAIGSHLRRFAGREVVRFGSGTPAPADPTAVAWRLQASSYDSSAGEFAELFERFLTEVPAGAVRALIIGEWGDAYEREGPIDLLAAAAGRLTGLRALFLGEMMSEECEISWIQQGEITPLLTAYPRLESLWVRGGTGLDLEPVRHAALRQLVVQTGGLHGGFVRAVGESDLPALDHLELWLGVQEYGGDATVEDLGGILSGARLPSLEYLALCNAELADQVAAALAAAPVVARLRTLDLSKGIMTDAGAEALLSGQPLTHLRRLDLHHHYLSDELAERLVAELPGVEVDVSDPQEAEEDDDEVWRYTAVSE